jgi:hypothetical protein
MLTGYTNIRHCERPKKRGNLDAFNVVCSNLELLLDLLHQNRNVTLRTANIHN